VSTHLRGWDGVAITAPVSFGYARHSPHGAAWFAGGVLRELLARSHLGKDAIDGLALASFTLAPDSVVTLTQTYGLRPRWLESLPYGGASGVIALRRAARAVQAGDAEVIACIAADTNRPEGFRELVANFSTFSVDASWPYGSGGPNTAFSLITARYMQQTGATREDFGRLCVAQRANARAVPHALLGGKPLSLEEYLAARPVAGPLHLYDCVMPCAGAEGFLVMSTERAQALGIPHARVLAADEQHNAFDHDGRAQGALPQAGSAHAGAGPARDPSDAVQWRAGWHAFAPRLWEAAGCGPGDIDLLETYDDYPVISMLQFEGLGFCAPGEAPRFVRETAFTNDGGGLPHNTSGGQLSVGQAGAAGGFLGLVEATRQLTGQALGVQVPHARRALVAGYGMINYDRGLCTSAAILERA
jgi:acetyl-CoA acetyltransferase